MAFPPETNFNLSFVVVITLSSDKFPFTKSSKEYFGLTTDNYVPKFNYIKDAKILILDDFGSGNYSSWAFEKLYQIITWRYNRKLPTVITSPNDFGKRHDAMISRIQDPLIGQMIKIESTDFRVKGKR